MPSTLLGPQAHTTQGILSPLLLHVLTPPRAETPHPLAADLSRGGRGLESGRTEDVLPRQPDWAGLVLWGSELLHEVINPTSCDVLSGHFPGISDSIWDFPQGDTILMCMGSY